MTDPVSAILLPARLAEVRRSGLLDTGAEEPFDRLTRLACEVIGTPFGFVTIVDERRSFWKSCIGVDATDPADRQNTVGESFCQYVIAADDAVIIEDARENPLTWNNPSIESMGVIAWAGFPVRAPNGQVLGTFCVVDSRPRQWNPQELRTLETLAHAAGGEVALRIAADEARADADRYQLLAHALQETLLPGHLPAIGGLDVALAQRLGGRVVPGAFGDAARTPTGWAVFAGEATARGVEGGRTAALAKHVLRSGAERATSPAIVVTELDVALRRWFDETGTPGEVSVAYVALRPDETSFTARICTAGSTVAVIRRAGGTTEQPAPTSGALGSTTRLSLKVADVRLAPGDSLALVSGAAAAGLGQRAAGDFAPGARGLADACLTGTGSAEDMIALAVRVLAPS